MSILAVVFDMDGLMLNTEDVYTLVGSELLGRRGCEFTDDLKNAMMGLRPQPAFETMIRWYSLADSWQTLQCESNATFLGLLGEHLALMPGLVELLDALERRGLPKAIATSSCREMTEACLAPFALAERFQFILTAEDIVCGKPDPEIYRTAASRFGVEPGKMLVLEDSQNGCRAAAAAGAFTVAVPADHSRGHDFSMAGLVIENLADPRLYAALDLN